jgi:hypothetical protein
MQEQNLGSATPPSGQAPVSVASQPVESIPAQPSRPTYTEDQQAHLNSLIGAAKKEGYEKALRERQEQPVQHAQAPVQPVPSYVPQHQPIPQPVSAPIDPQMQQQMIDAAVSKSLGTFMTQKQQEFEIKRQQEEAQQLLADLTPKIQSAQQKYADFNEKVNFTAFQGDEWFRALNKLDNLGDVVYDLMDKPAQFTALETLLNSGNKAKVEMAKKQLHNLSVSLKNNEASASKKVPNEPLKGVRPSNVSSSGDVNLTKAARDKYANRF